MKRRKFSMMLALAAATILAASITVSAQENTSIKSEPTEKATEATTEAPKTTTTSTEGATKEEKIVYETPITEDTALLIALDHAQYTKEEAEEVQIKKDIDDGKEIYEVEFYIGVNKFEYEIEIETGEILDYDVDD